MSEYINQRIKTLTCLLERPAIAGTERKLRLSSKANASRGESKWAAIQKAKAVQAEKRIGWVVGIQLGPVFESYRLSAEFFVVHIIRVGPRELDSDNLDGSAKNLRDGIAKAFGVDDGKRFVRYEVTPEKGPYAVRFRLHCEPRKGPEPEFDASDYERPRTYGAPPDVRPLDALEVFVKEQAIIDAKAVVYFANALEQGKPIVPGMKWRKEKKPKAKPTPNYRGPK